jgi:hypothetical protein
VRVVLCGSIDDGRAAPVVAAEEERMGRESEAGGRAKLVAERGDVVGAAPEAIVAEGRAGSGVGAAVAEAVDSDAR